MATSIMQSEFDKLDSDTSTFDSPAKVYVGVNTERLPESSALFNRNFIAVDTNTFAS